MATSRNITYTFSNQTAYDLWTDGVLYEWKGDSSGKFSYSPVRVKAYSVAKAFAACGDSDSGTGTTGKVKYWAVPAGASGNSQAVGHVSVGFSIAYDHNFYSNSHSYSGSGAFASKGAITYNSSGWNNDSSVAVTVTFSPFSGASTAQP